MNLNPKPIRIEPAFADREQVRAMFMRNAPYRALAAYAPEGVKDETREEDKKPLLPWFRGDWALDGKPLVEGAELILHNRNFVEAAKSAFGTSFVNPEFVAVNINGPSPAGRTHMDNPSFYGATRVDYPLPFLRMMGFSGLFDAWRVVRASTLCWFYEGPGGSFDYWPKGRDSPMRTEPPPFGNVALCADTDRAYHRIGAIGNDGAELPQMCQLREYQQWAVNVRKDCCANNREQCSKRVSPLRPSYMTDRGARVALALCGPLQGMVQPPARNASRPPWLKALCRWRICRVAS